MSYKTTKRDPNGMEHREEEEKMNEDESEVSLERLSRDLENANEAVRVARLRKREAEKGFELAIRSQFHWRQKLQLAMDKSIKKTRGEVK